MSTVVVYSSQTGFTKRYAEWLAEELGCQVVSLGDEPRFDASGFDVVVLGGWLHAGGLAGKKWLARAREKHLQTRFVVFAVGATPVEWTDMVEEALAKELPSPEFDDVERFYLRGGFAYERLGLPDKLAMKLFFKMQEKNAAADPRAAEMLEGMRGGFDGTDRRDGGAVGAVEAAAHPREHLGGAWVGGRLLLLHLEEHLHGQLVRQAQPLVGEPAAQVEPLHVVELRRGKLPRHRLVHHVGPLRRRRAHGERDEGGARVRCPGAREPLLPHQAARMEPAAEHDHVARACIYRVSPLHRHGPAAQLLCDPFRVPAREPCLRRVHHDGAHRAPPSAAAPAGAPIACAEKNRPRWSRMSGSASSQGTSESSSRNTGP